MTQFNECGAKKVYLIAMGEAIYKVITIAEIVKYRVPGLHQINDISCRVFKDEYMPLEEGLDKLVFTRKVACFQITLLKADDGTVNLDEFENKAVLQYGH